MRVAILTAVYDHYDTLKPIYPQADVDVDWVVVTDDSDLGDSASQLGWRAVYEPRPGVHPNRAAKTPKMLPHCYTDALASVWVDASYRIRSDQLVADLLALADPIAQFTHPYRDCIYDEADESLRLLKYRPEADLIRAQVADYRDGGHPRHWGLWATGVIARWHAPMVEMLGERWLFDCHRYSFQDQLSEAPCLRACALRPSPLPGTYLTNRWLSYEASPRHGTG